MKWFIIGVVIGFIIGFIVLSRIYDSYTESCFYPLNIPEPNNTPPETFPPYRPCEKQYECWIIYPNRLIIKDVFPNQILGYLESISVDLVE